MRRREVVVHQPMGTMTGQVITLPAHAHSLPNDRRARLLPAADGTCISVTHAKPPPQAFTPSWHLGPALLR